jgi:hypothetical protein
VGRVLDSRGVVFERFDTGDFLNEAAAVVFEAAGAGGSLSAAEIDGAAGGVAAVGVLGSGGRFEGSF